MNHDITRRDFLKLAGMLPFSMAVPRIVKEWDRKRPAENPQNVIIIVFDAFSAYNISLYGYQRETTPNLARLAERAIVYHNHYASGNFTAPGTASLLTGTLPWTHRAFHHAGRVEEAFVNENIFTAFDMYYRLAYSHNPMANGLLGQFKESLDNFVPRDKLFLRNETFISTLFENDDDIATISWLRAMKGREDGYSYSLFLSHLLYLSDKYQDRKIAKLQQEFPVGLPSIFTDHYYLLEDAVDWFGGMIENIPKPFLSYLHFMPPHAPYKPHRDFYGKFDTDGMIIIQKPLDIFSRDEEIRSEYTNKKRGLYDDFILYVDREFGRLFDFLDKSGLMENSWVILTSDHGEMFERGIIGHTTPVLYEPVIRIPLMIFKPGQRSRLDIYENTSAIDVLPTLLHITGQKNQANWTGGALLPPFRGSELGSNRSIYVLEARKNKKHAPLTVATIAMIKEHYKLMYFFGYEELGVGGERIELYDVNNDPEEMNNLYSSKRGTANEMLNELKSKLSEVNAPYV